MDVRTPEEYSRGHISNALNIDYYATDFQEQLDKLPRDKEYLLYCRTGNRSGHTLKTMQEMGFRHVYNLRGGISQWNAEGLPLTW